MTYRDRLSNFTIETENGDLFVFEFRDLTLKRNEQTGSFSFQDDIPYIQKTYHGAEIHNYELYLSGEDCDIAANEFWEATKPKTPLTLKYPAIEKAVNAQIMSIERIDALATAAGEVGFRVDILESSILKKAVEDTTRSAYIGQQYLVVQELNSKYYYEALPSTPSALQKAKNAITDATAAVSKALVAYDVATDTLADLKSIERTCSGLVETLDTTAELFAQAFQGYIELAVDSVEVLYKNSFIDDLISLFDVSSLDADDNTKLMLCTALTGGLVLASTATTSEAYGNKLSVFTRSTTIFSYYESLIAVADGLEIDSELIIQLNDLINLTAAKLEKISFQAKQQRTIETTKTEEIYTLVYRLIPCISSDALESEVESFIDVNNLGGKELFEIPPARKLIYYL